MTEPIPAGRLRLAESAPRQLAAMVRFGASVELDPTVAELVKLRASQLNRCAFCLDMHWKDARAAGEGEERLYSLDAWQESPLYDRRERAALALCESMTMLADGHVPDAVWADAAAEFDEGELAQLVCAIAAINTWNRLMIATRAEPGHYAPGDFDGAGATAGAQA